MHLKKTYQLAFSCKESSKAFSIQNDLKEEDSFFLTLCSNVSLEYTLLSSLVTGLEWPRGFQEVKVPRFHDYGTGRW